MTKNTQRTGPPPVFVDAIENGVARLLRRNEHGAVESYSFPAALLPEGAREGTWIELRVRVVPPPAGEDPATLRRQLGQGDSGGDIIL